MVVAMTCPVIESCHTIGKKWSIPIIEEIAFSKFGFNRFLTQSNLTPRILSIQLKELEDAGMIKKRFYKRANRKVAEYVLTQKGLELHDIITKIKLWNMKWSKVPDFCLSTPCTECPKYR